MSTQTHQSGDLSLRPLTAVEDEARGMFGSLVASPEVLAERFQLQSIEATLLPKALAWLHDANPWFTAYRSSCAEVKEVIDVVQSLRARGTLVARAPESLRSKHEELLHDAMGSDGLAIVIPVNDLNSVTGNMRHLRLAAHHISQS